MIGTPAQGVPGIPADTVADLLRIARWQVATGNGDALLLESQEQPGTPAEIAEARHRVTRLTGRDVLGDGAAYLDASAILSASISALDEREQFIASRRLLADQPETLDQLGARLALSRERVRQLESEVRAKLVQLLTSGSTLALVCQSVRELIAALLPIEDLLRRYPALQRHVDSVDQPVWRVLDLLDDGYEIHDGWCAAPSVSVARSSTQARLQELTNPYGVVSLEDFGALNDNLPPERARQTTLDWLRYCGLVLHGDYVLTRTQSLSDRAVALLSIAGTPLSAEEVLNQLGLERTLGSLKNAMSSDDRIERVDRDRWALLDWGLDAYTGVRALVSEELARNGGRGPDGPSR